MLPCSNYILPCRKNHPAQCRSTGYRYRCLLLLSITKPNGGQDGKCCLPYTCPRNTKDPTKRTVVDNICNSRSSGGVFNEGHSQNKGIVFVLRQIPMAKAESPSGKASFPSGIRLRTHSLMFCKAAFPFASGWRGTATIGPSGVIRNVSARRTTRAVSTLHNV
jgi:hypothetical protein